MNVLTVGDVRTTHWINLSSDAPPTAGPAPQVMLTDVGREEGGVMEGLRMRGNDSTPWLMTNPH